MRAYYNENDPKTAAWLRELVRCGHIAPGLVDERSIEDVRPCELSDLWDRGVRQFHFFAGIGGWSYALRLAGWPDKDSAIRCEGVSDNVERRGVDGALAHNNNERHDRSGPCGTGRDEFADVGVVGDNNNTRLEGRGVSASGRANERTPWTPSDVVWCRDGKRRPVEPGTFPLAHGVSGRVGLLRGYGNAIVPQVAAAFIRAYLDVEP